MHKLTRICYNSKNWRFPTGESKELEGKNSYVHQHGFGHEEWLFRSEWKIGDWRYAFLQGVNKSRKKLADEKEPVDLTLFTIDGKRRHRFVAKINAVECLDPKHAETALRIFKEKGWFDTMLQEIEAVGGDSKALGNSPEVNNILNIRFHLANVIPEDKIVQPDDPVMRLNRYMLYDLTKLDAKTSADSLRHRKSAESEPVMRTVFRRATGAVEYDPQHVSMQTKLLAKLKDEFPGAAIKREEDFIDASVCTAAEFILFEIKSDLKPRIVIRQALGQLLEYAFHPQRAQSLPVRLVIVGQCLLSDDEQCYLDLLRQKFSLPLEYRIVSP